MTHTIPALLTPRRRPAGILAVREWGLQVAENGAAHHTQQYNVMQADKPRLVVRRGQPFTLVLHTSKAFKEDDHKISLVFSVKDAKQPNFGNHTLVGVCVGLEPVNGWSASLITATDKEIKLSVTTSPGAVIGEWQVEADVKSAGQTHSYPCPQPIYLLFNCWCPDDTTYLEKEAERQEYVVNDFGLIWRGTAKMLRPCPWNFGQYEKGVLECVLEVLNNVCKMTSAHRNDPVKVSRVLSAGINSPDDSGVLVGKWGDDFSGGVAPTEWGGSQRILQQYYKTKKPVKYGQCWVFSGVMTAACRAIGLPCRSVTNFSSAHDTHGSLTIDYFFDDESEAIERLNSDSVWNFHVWNEAWMTRPDIGEEYDGWQAVDATPQEESDGQYRCGPASLKAIKEGHINKPFDIPFIFAEINADKLYWKYRGPCQPMKLLGCNLDGIGQFLSTKAVGKFAREDVTHLYKYEEASKEERDVMKNALRLCENTFARYYLNEKMEDVEFDFKMNDDIVIGQPFTSSVEVHNKGEKQYKVEVVLRADTVLYTGATKHQVKTHRQTITLHPYSKEKMTLEVSFEEYYKKLTFQCAFNLSCLGKVEETGFEYFAQDDFRCRKPDIKVEYEGEMKLDEECVCHAYFTNPMPMGLTRGWFIVQGAGLTEVLILRIRETIAVAGEVRCQFKVKPSRAGERTLSINFYSKELEDVDGMLTVTVPEPKPAACETNADGDAPVTNETILETSLTEPACEES
ncbi:Annulin [Chionoecetes opilio]|uniref:protein-glutamine gamma-glutamyltransferase n=1 Tax=Chionoecetes opilio TaxID=41210 RepID=A0A8J4YSG1_CHIOP|nr:Annulin [Chionoecetes opilio]